MTTSPRRLIVGGMVAGALAVVVACSNPTSTSPSRPIGPGVAGAIIKGPDTIAPGQTGRFTAAVRYSDGFIKEAGPTTDVRWFTNSSSTLQINSAGVATGQNRLSEAIITLEVRIPGSNPNNPQVLRSTKEVVVVPDGTFRVSGKVVEGDFPQLAVSQARVEFIPGGSMLTTGSGDYKIYGVPADAEVRVTKDGYQTVVESLHLTSHTTRNFGLPLAGARLNLAGTYTLGIDVVSCSSSTPLSFDLQHRRYDATITQSGPLLEVTLTEPRFRLNAAGKGNRFLGQATSTNAKFTLDFYSYYYYYNYVYKLYPSVAERLQDNSILVVDGQSTVTPSGDGFAGTLNGGVSRWGGAFPNQGIFQGGCFSSTTQFTLTRK